MSFDARHHANEPASGKPDLTRRGFLAGAAATGALGVIGVNLFVRQGFDPGGVANASRQKRLRLPLPFYDEALLLHRNPLKEIFLFSVYNVYRHVVLYHARSEPCDGGNLYSTCSSSKS